MPGPLPKENRARKNAPTIPTTNLPVAGRTEPAPRIPSWVHLGKAGRAWWKWAWRTPQAAAWSSGAVDFVARRASLEDDMAAISDVEGLDVYDIVDADTLAAVRQVMGRLSALAIGKTQLCREMREIDDRLGLTPKGMAALRWKVVSDDKPALTPVARPDFKRKAV